MNFDKLTHAEAQLVKLLATYEGMWFGFITGILLDIFQFVELSFWAIVVPVIGLILFAFIIAVFMVKHLDIKDFPPGIED